MHGADVIHGRLLAIEVIWLGGGWGNQLDDTRISRVSGFSNAPPGVHV
jgi:hypothetical protein